MGCASSTPMVTAKDNDIFKAATHVASSATKTAEDAVEEVKEVVDKTIETAKEKITTAVDGAKKDIENTVKEKSEMLDDVKKDIMGKLHLQDTIKDHMDEIKTDAEETENIKESVTNLRSAMAKESETDLQIKDIDTYSLESSTTEPEIEQILANANKAKKEQHNSDDDDEDDDDDDDDDGRGSMLKIPQPHVPDMETLKAHLAEQKQQQQQMLANIAAEATSSSSSIAEDIDSSNKSIINNAAQMIMENDTIAKKTTTTMSESNANDMTAAGNETTSTTKITTTTTHTVTKTDNNNIGDTTDMQQKETTEAMPTANENAESMDVTESIKPISNTATTTTTTSTAAAQQPPKKSKKTNKTDEPERPKTTEWEKLADTLSHTRKFNPHDAFRRGSTLTKFGATPTQTAPGYITAHVRAGGGGTMDEDSAGSDAVSHRYSARAGGRRLQQQQQLVGPHSTARPQSVQQHQRQPIENKQLNSLRRNGNVAHGGRKFDFNPNRSRIAEHEVSVSSNTILDTIPKAQAQSAFNDSTALSDAPESVKSPFKLRSLLSRPFNGLLNNNNNNNNNTNANNNNVTMTHLEAPERPPQSQSQFNAALYSLSSAVTAVATTAHATSKLASICPIPPPSPTVPPTIIHSNDSLMRESSNNSLFSNNSLTSMDSVDKYRASRSISRPLPAAMGNRLPVRNTSSFLSTPRSPMSLRKSYTDLYFISTNNEANEYQPPVIIPPIPPSPLTVENHKSVRNTSSFLSTPRSPFSLRKSYTDLYFISMENDANDWKPPKKFTSTNSNNRTPNNFQRKTYNRNKENAGNLLQLHDRVPARRRYHSCEVCSRRYFVS